MSKKLSIVTSSLYSYDGNTEILGGVERYTRDLAFLCRKIGFDVTIHQFGTTYWQKNYEGFPLKAYPWNSDSEKCIEETMKIDLDKADYVIYMWIGFQKKYKNNSISICHGIWFDLPGSDGSWGRNEINAHIIPAMNQLSSLVAVDLNFINFCRSVIPFADNNKTTYIPNYVNTELFKPLEKVNDGSIEILYPRRYDPWRGIYIMEQIVPYILKKYPQVIFNFAIDQNNDNFNREWLQWYNIQPNKNRIKYNHYPMDKMPEVYQSADIVVIPSIGSEGTSLSVLEAMAMKKAIICSNVGGLSNIIQHQVSGLLINPAEENVIDAIEYYINNPIKRMLHGDMAYKIALMGFSKNSWEEKWTALINKYFI